MWVRIVAVLVLLVPNLGAAGLLHYGVSFETTDGVNSIEGTGFFLADTDQDAILGGQLVCDEFDIVWKSASPPSLALEYKYYGGDVVAAGTVNGVDRVTGGMSKLDLLFYLRTPAEDGRFSDKLHHHFNDGHLAIWSIIDLSASGRSGDDWLASGPLDTFIEVTPPVSMANIPEPATLFLFASGVGVLMMRRMMGRDRPNV